MANRICPNCDEPFPIPSGPGAPQKYCSDSCRYTDKNKKRRAKNGSSFEGDPMDKSTKQGEAEAINLSPAGWAAWIFKNHDLDASQQQLVMIGLEILTVARDGEEDIKVRMAAMGRFQAVISQLDLPTIVEDEEEEEVAPIIHTTRPTVDPRKQLREVS